MCSLSQSKIINCQKFFRFSLSPDFLVYRKLTPVLLMMVWNMFRFVWRKVRGGKWLDKLSHRHFSSRRCTRVKNLEVWDVFTKKIWVGGHDKGTPFNVFKLFFENFQWGPVLSPLPLCDFKVVLHFSIIYLFVIKTSVGG